MPQGSTPALPLLLHIRKMGYVRGWVDPVALRLRSQPRCGLDNRSGPWAFGTKGGSERLQVDMTGLPRLLLQASALSYTFPKSRLKT